MTHVPLTSPARILIITPSLDGRDGLSCLARQVVDAVRSSFADSVLDVWVLAPAGQAVRIRISSAMGQRSTLVRWSSRRRAGPTCPTW